MSGSSERLRLALEQAEPCVLVTVARALGSTPREAGARMLVTAADAEGTIGGGRLELEAIAEARRLIANGMGRADIDVPLGPSIGQCCGGRVTLRLERADENTLRRLDEIERDERDEFPHVYLFGAGHVGKAIASALASLPLHLVWVDSRADAFPGTTPSGVERIVASDPVGRLCDAPPDACILVLTHSHALDFELTEAALRRGDLAYVGLIGSATKRGRFERWYLARGGAGDLRRLICPIGAGLTRDKRPAVIAAMVAAEVLIAQDRARDRVVAFGGHKVPA